MPKSKPEDRDGTGLGLVDYEHENQFRLITAARDALTEGGDPSQIHEILEVLVQYTKVHSMTENLLMRLYRYPCLDDHVSQHIEMDQKSENIVNAYKNGGAQPALQELIGFYDWVREHTGHDDGDFEDHIMKLKTRKK